MQAVKDFEAGPIEYPRAWEDEYRRTLTVAQWTREFPEFARYGLTSTRSGTLDLFAQHALM